MINIDATMIADINNSVQDAFPNVQGIYLFGSFAVGNATEGSDIDIGILLPHDSAKKAGGLALSTLHLLLEKQLKRTVDLINLRLVSTVLQNEVINNGKLIKCRDDYAVQEFEMLAASFYQKLNEERKEILDAFWQSGKAFAV